MRFKLKYIYALVVFLLIFLVIHLYQQNSDDLKTILEFHHQDGVVHWDLNRRADQKKRKDWHDYKSMQNDNLRNGPGEHGAAVHILEREKSKDAYHDNGFNIFVSDRISLNRSLSDIRHKNCRKRQYLIDLPSVSVIIPFYNEGWSSLFRTIHSILNRSPVELLHEIVLVDDDSTMDHLKARLDEEIIEYSKVKLIRLRQRMGLIGARISGVKHASGDIVVIFDSHVEVTHNWLPPLIEPVALDRKTVSCPMIDVIDKDNFHYSTQSGDAMRGAFDWELFYKRIPIPPEKVSSDPSDPFEDPVMAGGLFAIDRLYFNEIGLYDPGLEIWGGEQYELSFKVWMCGGRIVDTPCSRVGHIYRNFMPYSFPPGTNINKNFKRVAEVWMDEYKEYFYKKRPFVRNINPGNLVKQKQLRRDLMCKSFRWFMTEIAPDIVKHYPPVPPPSVAWGKLSNGESDLCLDSKFGTQGMPVSISPCKNKGVADQNFFLTWKEDIRPGTDPDSLRSICFDGQGVGKQVILWECHGQRGNQLWKYQPKTRTLIHAHTRSCLAADNGQVLLRLCDAQDPKQMWTWQHLDLEQLEKLISKSDK